MFIVYVFTVLPHPKAPGMAVVPPCNKVHIQ